MRAKGWLFEIGGKKFVAIDSMNPPTYCISTNTFSIMFFEKSFLDMSIFIYKQNHYIPFKSGKTLFTAILFYSLSAINISVIIYVRQIDPLNEKYQSDMIGEKKINQEVTLSVKVLLASSMIHQIWPDEQHSRTHYFIRNI